MRGAKTGAPHRQLVLNGRMLVPAGASKATQRIPITVCRYYKTPSGRVVWDTTGAHVTREVLTAPLHLPGILSAVARRLRLRIPGTLSVSMSDNRYGVDLDCRWALTPARSGSIAEIRLSHVVPPYTPHRDVAETLDRGTEQWTFLPDGVDKRHLYQAASLLHHFTDEQLAGPWRYHKPRKTAADRAHGRRIKAWTKLVPWIMPLPGRRGLTVDQVERLLMRARTMMSTGGGR